MITLQEQMNAMQTQLAAARREAAAVSAVVAAGRVEAAALAATRSPILP